MTVSHEHRFVFVKTRKTAGTSIEVLLAPRAGDDAVVTRILEDVPGHEPRNHRGRFSAVPELRAHPLQARATITQWRNRNAFYSHLPAWRARHRIGRDRFDGYLVFCFERDPWDKATSMYFWATRAEADPPSFETWAGDRRAGLSDWYLYAEGSRLLVDTADLPRLKAQTRAARQVTFTPRAADLVRRAYAREFAQFGYAEDPPEVLR